MDQDLYDFIINEIGPNSASVAKIAARIFDKKYVFHIFGKRKYWFEREPGKKLIVIPDMIIRNRLANELPDIIRNVREKYKADPEYIKIEAMFNTLQSIDAMNYTLVILTEKRNDLHELDKIDESRDIDLQIKDTEADIEYLTTKQNIQRSEIKDRKFADLVYVEDQLHNRRFKNEVMKDLEVILYEPHD
jgi:hypothetical protein